MKVYFSASISKMTDELRKDCNSICDYIDELGHVSLFERRFNDKNYYLNRTEQKNFEEQQRISKQKKEADVVVVEITNPSIGIGQEISMALLHNKYVIALHNENTNPHVLTDIKTEKLIVLPYRRATLKKVVSDAMEFITENKDQRFNLILSNDIVAFLDSISERRGKSKAEIIRNLILNEMKIEDRYL